MKYLLIVFLFPFSFYGQNDIHTENVELEGFYKYDTDNSEFYEVYNGKVLQPVYLDIKENNVRLPKKIESTCLVKLRGKRLRKGSVTREHYYNNQIILDKIIWAKKDVLLEDYLRKNTKSHRAVNKPYEAEGFLRLDDYDTLFYAREKNVLYPTVTAILTEKLSIENKKMYDKINKGYYYSREYPLVKIKGYYSDRKKGDLYDEVKIEKIVGIDTLVNIEKFESDDNNKIIENIEYFEEEGFYSKGMEHSAFTILRNDSLVGGRGWVSFDHYIQEIDSIRDIVQHRAPDMKRGVYMKVRGVKQSGDGYGHFGGCNYLLRVTKIEAIDTSRTRWGFIIDQIDKGKYFRGRKITYPDILKEGKEYTFKGTSHAYFDSTSVDVDSIYDIDLKLKRKGGYLHYKYKVSYKDRILKNMESRNTIDVDWFIRPSEWKEADAEIYEATSEEMTFGSMSLFKISVGNKLDEQGKIVIYIDDQTKYGIFIKLYSERQ